MLIVSSIVLLGRGGKNIEHTRLRKISFLFLLIYYYMSTYEISVCY